MRYRVTHTTQATLPNNPSKEVSSNAWNEEHTVDVIASPTVSLSGGSTNEIGSTVADVNLAFTTNGAMTSRELTGGVTVSLGPGGSGTYDHIGANLTSNTTYTITVNDGVESANDSTTVSFLNRRYYGATADDALDAAEVLLLDGLEFASSRATTKVFDCTGGKYIWICYPDDLGAATFKINGFSSTFVLTSQTVTNASGYPETYRCYRSLELQNGASVTVEVS